MWARPQSHQAMKPLRRTRPSWATALRASDRRQGAEVAVVERRRALAARRASDGSRDVGALLLRHGRDARQRLPFPIERMRRVADHEDVRMPGHRKIGRDLDPAGAIGLGAEPLPGRRRAHAGGPDDGAGLDPLGADRHAARRRSSSPGVPSDLDAELSRASVCAFSDREPSKAGSSRGPASTRMTRAERGSMVRKSAASALRASSAIAPAISTPVGPPPTTTKVSRRRALGGVALGLGALERQQDLAAQERRVVDLLEARARGAPSRRGRNRRAARRSRG